MFGDVWIRGFQQGESLNEKISSISRENLRKESGNIGLIIFNDEYGNMIC